MAITAKTKKCARRRCGLPFTSDNKRKKYCSDACRNREGQRKLRARARRNGRGETSNG